MDEQMNNNGYQSQPNPYQPNPGQVPNQNKDSIAIAVLVLGIVSICLFCLVWGVISLACAIVSLVLYSRNKTMFSPQKKRHGDSRIYYIDYWLCAWCNRTCSLCGCILYSGINCVLYI